MAEGTGDAETPAPPAFPTPHDEAAGAGGTPALDAREHARDWRHRAALYGAVAALAVAVRLALFLGAGYPQRMAADGRWYDRLGRDFAENLRFVKADGTPNTQKPPLYPAFVATVYLVFGRNPDAVRAIQVVMAGATAALAAAVALRLFGSYPVAAVTGGLLPSTGRSSRFRSIC